MSDPSPVPTLVDGVDIDAVHRAVEACLGVSSVGSGTLAALTTYLPGRRVPGIRINPDSIELEVVAEWGTSAAAVSTEIRHAIGALTAGRSVDITIADIADPSTKDSS